MMVQEYSSCGPTSNRRASVDVAIVFCLAVQTIAIHSAVTVVIRFVEFAIFLHQPTDFVVTR